MKKSKKGRNVTLLAGLLLVVIAVAVAWANWAAVRFFLEFETLERNSEGYPEFRHRRTGIVFVGLTGGTFFMGSPETEADRQPIEGPVHEVTLSPFLIAKYEVSQAEWKEVTGDNPSRFKGDAYPVEQVSWTDCRDYCAKVGFSLPTEAQWEYACRGGSSQAISGTGRKKDMGWTGGSSGLRTRPVGQKMANGFGLHDTHGNVFEWCEDRYNEQFYETSDATRIDPLCTYGSSFRVVRGGSCANTDCRSAQRARQAPDTVLSTLGFRPVYDPGQAGVPELAAPPDP